MVSEFRFILIRVIRTALLALIGFGGQLQANQPDTTLLPIKTIRVAVYVFQDDAGTRNFHPDSAGQVAFLHSLADWVNHRFANLDTLRPAVSSAYVRDCRVRVRLDKIDYRKDSRAWDCSSEIDAPYMRDEYVDMDSTLTYLDKYQTLPIFIGGNYTVIGGHSRNIGDRGYIAVRGYYDTFMTQPLDVAMDECGRNLAHEIGHCLGLTHNFHGGPDGDQCDECDDNGCPVQGTSNNLMDYWPSYGHALSLCQFRRIQYFLSGGSGNISEAVINDSCYLTAGSVVRIAPGDTVLVADTLYAHGNWVVSPGGTLRVTGYLSMPGETEISVEPAGKLLVDGGTIGNLCGDLWSGVRITAAPGNYPAQIDVVNGGIIENARTAILATAAVTPQFNKAILRNCTESLVFLQNSLDSLSLTGCDFEVTTKLNHYEEGEVPLSFVRSESIPRLVIRQSRFINQPGTNIFDANWMGSGIVTNSRSALIADCEFTNLTCAVDVWSQNPDARIDLTDNRFTDNRYAIRSVHPGIQWIKNNQFAMQRFNSGPTAGIFLSHPGRFVVFGNRFKSQYGGGLQSGVVISQPSADNSTVFNNDFTNLPVGIFLDGPPAIDSTLLTWARTGSPANFLRVGPQFRFNRYDTVGIRLAVVKDSIFGSAIGEPSYISEEGDLPATQWNPGGYAWYTDKLPLVAFPGWKPLATARQGYDFYWFMNLPGNLPGQPAWAPGADGKLKKSTLISELGSYLNTLADIPESADWYFGSGIYKALERIRQFPAALRSSALSGYWDRFSAEDDAWTRQSLGSIAGEFVRADTLLAGLGTFLAEKSLDEWINLRPVIKPDELPEPMPEIRPEFEFPELRFFRFVRPAQSRSPLPAFMLYPNPASDYITIQPLAGFSLETAWTAHILYADGRLAKTLRIATWQEQKIQVSDLPAGMYIIEISDGNQYLGAVKFIKPPILLK